MEEQNFEGELTFNNVIIAYHTSIFVILQLIPIILSFFQVLTHLFRMTIWYQSGKSNKQHLIL